MKVHLGMSYNQLMKHMRSSGVQISGPSQKRQLLLAGYYHGYKGYRYCKEPNNKIAFSNFTQIQAVIDFDEEIKACLYRPVMQFETALKSIVSNIVVREAKTDSFSVLIEELMHSSNHKKQSDFIKSKFEMRDDIYSSLTRAYKNGNIVKHYYDKDAYVPIWAVFEVITLGQFGRFVELLDAKIKLKISAELGIPVSFNTDGKLLSTIIFLLRDFRNAIAHNGIIFDCRYRGNRGIDQTLCSWLHQATSVSGIRFNSVIDDVILILTLMKNLKFRKPFLYSTVKKITSNNCDLQKSLGVQFYFQIFPTDSDRKLKELDHFLHTV